MHVRLGGGCGCDGAAGGGYGGGVQQAGATREAASSVRVSNSTKLTVQTAEGDQVTISLEARARLQTASVQGEQGAAQVVRGSASSKVQVEVKGSLSEEEAADIAKLLESLQSSGGTESNFGDLDSLSAFQYRQRQTVEAGSLFRYAA